MPSSAGVIMIEAKLWFCLAGDVMLGLTEAKEPRLILLATVYGRFSSDRVKVVLLPRVTVRLSFTILASSNSLSAFKINWYWVAAWAHVGSDICVSVAASGHGTCIELRLQQPNVYGVLTAWNPKAWNAKP